jgi:hypothetical protein
MIPSQQISEMSDAQRSAWIDSLTEDESEILHCPQTSKCVLVFISLLKQLLADDIPASYRLKFLQWLDRRNDWWCSLEIIAAIDPMCDDGHELLRETMKLGHKKGFDTLGSWEVFNAFVCAQPESVDRDQDGKEPESFFRKVGIMSAAPQITNEYVNVFLPAQAIPRGYEYSLVLISLTKYLLTQKMPAKERLEFLEQL